MWWPGFNQDVEQFVKQCSNCQMCLPCPPLAPVHSWDNPKRPWYRLHLDFAGPFMDRMYLILVDAYSKWLDVCIMNTITSGSTIEKLQAIFAVHGLPKTIVTDNGSSFTSAEFNQFLRSNGIQHITSSPYHPSTNGLAERAVQSFKQGMRKIEDGSIHSRISRFLFRYRITPHPSTGISPAESLMGRKLRSCLDLIYPDAAKKMDNKQQRQQEARTTKVRTFVVGDKVLVRDFRSPKMKWMTGQVVSISGPLSYRVKVADGIVRRHVDNVRKCYFDTTNNDEFDDLLIDSMPTQVDNHDSTPDTMEQNVSIESPPDNQPISSSSDD